MALTLLLLVWLASTRGTFRCADDYLLDVARARLADSYAPENVLLVYANPAVFQAADGRLSDLIERVLEYQPARIGIAANVSATQREQLTSAGLPTNVVVGQAGTDIGQNFLKLWLDQAVYRWHCARIVGPQTVIDSLESRLARAQQGSNVRIPRGFFGIRFQGGSASMPHVDHQSFIDKSVIAELVADKIVLIGQHEEPELGFVTPTTVGGERMSRLELHGNILETLLRGDSIHRINRLSALVVMLVSSVISSFLFRQVRTCYVMHVGAAVLIGIAVVTWCALALCSTQLPITALWTLTLLSFIGVMTSRFQVLTNFFYDWKLLRRVNLKTTRRQSDDEIWACVAASALQIFHPTRVAIFESEIGSRKLILRETIGCQCAEVIERRRDLNRAPYRDGFEQRGILELKGRPILKSEDPVNKDQPNVELLIPLIDGDDPVGALVLEVEATVMQQWRDFDECLTEFADQMAGFLAGARERELEKLLADKAFHRHRHLPERIVARSLYQDEVDHRAYEDILASELECSETAVAIYDVFGNLLTSNQRMMDLLQQRDVAVDESSCSEVLAALTSRQVESCRKWVRRCLIDFSAEEIMITGKDSDQTPSMLFVKPLKSADATGQDAIEERFLSIQVIDGSIFRDMHQWRLKISETQSTILLEQMSRFQQFAGQLKDDSFAFSEQEIATEILDTLDQCQSVIESGLSERPADWIAVDTNPILQTAIRSCRSDLAARGINIQNHTDLESTEAICNPMLLRRLFAAILECLAQDASRQSDIAVCVEHEEHRLRYTFDIETKGDAESNEPAPLRGKAASILIEQKSERFAEISSWLQHWDAKLTISCGSRYQLSIQLDLACSIAELMSKQQHSIQA